MRAPKEEDMKAYVTPSLVGRGNAVAETHASESGLAETSGQINRKVPSLVGSVGYYL
jgi:hypothetical protein